MADRATDGQLVGMIQALLTAALEEQKKSLDQQVETMRRAYEDQVRSITASFQLQIEAIKAEVAAAFQAQLTALQNSNSAAPSYADVARTPPNSRPSNLRSFPSGNTNQTSFTDTLYCTVDVSRVDESNKDKTSTKAIRTAIEKEIQAGDNSDKSWRCVAVTRDPRHNDRVRVTCKDEAELQKVKEAAARTTTTGVRVLRDQLYPVKLDNARKDAVLDTEGNLRPGKADEFGKENGVKVAKMAWLSRKDNGKEYGSMVVYVTKGSDAIRLLQEGYFHLDGESAFTNPYEKRTGPIQCYKCQAIGHKAFSCKKAQICAKCAGVGHHHRDCSNEVSKCVPCGGPHESFSKNCRILYPTRHE